MNLQDQQGESDSGTESDDDEDGDCKIRQGKIFLSMQRFKILAVGFYYMQ